jgi:hypothetical protein
MLAFEDWLAIRWRFLSYLKRHQKLGTEWHTSLKCYLAATPMNRDAVEGDKKRNPRAHRIGAIVASGGMAHQGPGSIAIIEDENLG